MKQSLKSQGSTNKPRFSKRQMCDYKTSFIPRIRKIIGEIGLPQETSKSYIKNGDNKNPYRYNNKPMKIYSTTKSFQQQKLKDKINSKQRNSFLDKSADLHHKKEVNSKQKNGNQSTLRPVHSSIPLSLNAVRQDSQEKLQRDQWPLNSQAKQKIPEDVVYDYFCSKYRKYTKLKKPKEDCDALRDFHHKQNIILNNLIREGLIQENKFRLISRFYDTCAIMKQKTYRPQTSSHSFSLSQCKVKHK